MNASVGGLIHWAAPYDLLVTLLTLGRERRFREGLLQLAHLAPGESVLDIGCGTGTLAIAARRLVGDGPAVQGIDASPEMIVRARRKAAKAGAAVSFEVAPAQSLPSPDRTFDVVLSTVMLHHLPRAGRALAVAEARRVLKPGGRILVVDFAQNTRRRKGLLGHFHGHGGVTARDLVTLVADAGFSVQESGPAGTWDLHYVLGENSIT